MPDIKAWAQQNKVPLIIGGGVLGAIVLYSLAKKNSAGSANNQVTLATLHSDLQSIDYRLQQENSYLSSSASMSPLVPSFDVTDIDLITPNYPGSNPPVPTHAPGRKNTAVTHRAGSTTETSAGRREYTNAVPSKILPPNVEGRGTGDYLPYGFGGAMNFPGDAADYFGLN